MRFEPLPAVGRAVFIGALHRGTPFADQRIARRVENLVTLPLAMLSELGSLPRLLAWQQDGAQSPHQGPGATPARRTTPLRIPNSIDNLSSQDPFVRVAATLPIEPGLPHHSIVGRIDSSVALEQNSDGVVLYASAHLDSALSEHVISSGHSVQEHPAAILEIRRILHLHLKALASNGAFAP